MYIDNKVNNFSENKHINTIILYIILASTIILSRDTLITRLKIGFETSFFIYMIIIFIAYAWIIIRHRKNTYIDLNKIKYIIIYVSAILIGCTLKKDFQLYHVSIIFYLFVVVLFIHIFTFEDFFSIFSDIMTFLGVYSLVTLFLIRGFLFPNGLTNTDITILTNTAGTDFFDLGLNFVVALKYYLRNFGIFREPGVYQFFLMIPLYYELLLRVKPRWFNIMILVITILSTFSPPALLVLVIILILSIIKTLKQDKISKKNKYYILIFIICFSTIIAYHYYNNNDFNMLISEMFKKVVTLNQSTGMRLNSSVNDFKFFISSPIIGNLFDNITSPLSYSINSTLSTFAIYGGLVGFYHLWLHFQFSSLLFKSRYLKIISFLSILILVNSQFLLGNVMYWIFSFSFLLTRNTCADEAKTYNVGFKYIFKKARDKL